MAGSPLRKGPVEAAASSRAPIEDVAPPPPPPVDALDLVLDKDELEMLQIFHRSFKLPGLQHGLLKPVCTDDYFPEDAADYHEPAAADQLQALMKQTAELRMQADEVLEEEPLEDLASEEPASQVFRTAAPTLSAAPVRTVRRPGSGVRPPSGGSRPPSQGSRPPRR